MKDTLKKVRLYVKFLFILGLLFIRCSSPGTNDSLPTTRKNMEEAPENFPYFKEKKASLLWYVDHYKKIQTFNYSKKNSKRNEVIDLAQVEGDIIIGIYTPRTLTGVFKDKKIAFFYKDKEVYSFKGHSYTPFWIVDERILIYADYYYRRQNCEVVSYDLVEQKQLWRTALMGTGVTTVIMLYWNKINMFVEENQVHIIGVEGNGKYYEVLDIRTGKTLYNARLVDHKYEVTVDKLSSTKKEKQIK